MLITVYCHIQTLAHTVETFTDPTEEKQKYAGNQH